MGNLLGFRGLFGFGLYIAFLYESANLFSFMKKTVGSGGQEIELKNIVLLLCILRILIKENCKTALGFWFYMIIQRLQWEKGRMNG